MYKGCRWNSSYRFYTTVFERKGKGKVTYSHKQHTKTEKKKEFRPIVFLVVAIDLEVLFQSLIGSFGLSVTFRMVSRSEMKFHVQIVKDWGFQCLMKTGRLGYYLPSPTTVSWDVKLVFAKAQNWIAKLYE